MKRSKCVMLVMALAAAVLLPGCVRTDLRPLAVVMLVQKTDALLEEAVVNGLYTQFDQHYEAPGVLAPERFPEWGRDTYAECIYWTDEFTMRMLGGADPLEGRAWGWILINKDLDSHILEIGYENVETGETVTLLSAWDEPTDEAENDASTSP